jgi:hypothetical protein
MATFTGYSFNLSADEAWKIACVLCDASRVARENGSTATSTELYNLATKLSCLSFEADVLGYDKAEQIELTCRSKAK